LAAQAEQAARPGLDELKGLGDKTRIRLEEAGVKTIEDLSHRSVDELSTIPMIGEKSALKLLALTEAWFQEQAQGEDEETVEEVGAELA
jgi:predicted flap endonuclease-1-like 5' DNA nuclease